MMALQDARTYRSCLFRPTALALFAVLAPGVAVAGAPDDLAAPIPITSPYYEPVVLNADLEQPPVHAGEWIVFTNFDGADMNGNNIGGCPWGDNSPQMNCSTIFQGEVLPFGGGAARRAAVVQVIRNDLKPFNILVTDVRPQTGDYDMEMIGNWNPPPGGGFAGVAPTIDCFNGNGGEVSFTLDYTVSPNGIAKAVLQEIAHTWGLEHVDSKSDLLYPTTESVPDPDFVDSCFQIVELSGGMTVPDNNILCKNQHQMFCPAGQQNSYQELLMIFGQGSPDLIAPTVKITAPADGAEVGPDVDVIVHVEDNQSPQAIEFILKLDGPGSAETPPSDWPAPSDLEFPIKKLAPGTYTITAIGRDEDANEATDSITIVVKSMDPDPGTTGDPDTTGGTTADPGTTGSDPGTTADDPTGEPTTGDSGGNTSNATGASSTGNPATGGEPTGEDGCACRSGASTAGAPALLLLLGLAGRRRRPRT